MTKKVSEIAKKLKVDNKEVLERLNSMGVEAKNQDSMVSDIDAQAVVNMVLHSRKKAAETKIVQAVPQKRSRSTKKAESNREVKIEVKQADISVLLERGKAQQRSREAARAKKAEATGETKMLSRTGITPPAGIPMRKSAASQTAADKPLSQQASEQTPTSAKIGPIAPPVGTPMRKSEVPQPDREEKIVDEMVASTVPIAETEIPEAAVAPAKEAVKAAVEPTIAEPKTAEPAAVKPAAEKKVGAEETVTAQPGAAPASPTATVVTPAVTDQTESPAPVKASETTSVKKPAAQKQEEKPLKPAAEIRSGRPKAEEHKAERPKAERERSNVQRAEKPKPETAGGLDRRMRRVADDRKTGPADKRKKRPAAFDRSSLEKQPLKKPRKRKVQKVEEEISGVDMEKLAPGTCVINVPITVKGLAEQLACSTSDIIVSLMGLGIMANINQNLDEDMVVLLGEELGIALVVDKVEEEVVEEGLETFEDDESDLTTRPPVITVMGHVDHGKTSLLDAIRKTNVTEFESGGITQHIGASEVVINGQKIVFLDTPGHEAFTTMRARGAHVTDIAVLVVAADDSVKPQTIESISHAKAAGVPIIVAINKMDKPDANPDRVKQDLAGLPTDQRVLVEEYGGETISVPVSAKTGDGIKSLLEMILLQAEVLELKANPNRLAMGTIIEARLDKNRGPVATLLVMNGSLRSGMSIVAGVCSGRIRAMTNFKGDLIQKAGPATAVEITGLTEVPEAGDEFYAVKEDRQAREIAEQRRLKQREEVMARNASVSLEQLFSQIQQGEIKELNLIIKADVMGSVDALIQSLEKLQTENVKVRIIHSGVGAVTESDIMLASTSNAIIIGFNVRPSTGISALADRENVEIRSYRIIYEILDDIEAALKGMLDPVYKEVLLGKAEVRNTFKVPGVGIIGGAYVVEGKVARNAEVRLVRDGIVIHEGKISSLKRFKDDAKEVAQGFECGIGIENFNDVKEGDVIEAFKMEEVDRH
ncbi:MAG TPA: translation initiation factor IF-2 [Clostridiales bacterium]|jgi:translation initiation factor IF-2|nr:translation initiation factor IF-2 [Clostridiales bacterium]